MITMTKLAVAEAFVLDVLGRSTKGQSRFHFTRPNYNQPNQGRPEGITADMVNAAIRSLEAQGKVTTLGPVTSAYTQIRAGTP